MESPHTLSRSTDPETSLFAGHEAAKEIEKSIEIVRLVMSDGQLRTDEQIYEAHLTVGEARTSPDRIRHGRLYLALRGDLVDTGLRRRTSSGGMSRVWRSK